MQSKAAIKLRHNRSEQNLINFNRIEHNSKTAKLTLKILFRDFQLLSIFNLNKLQTCCFMYTIFNCLLPTVFQNLFSLNSNVHNHNTRQSSKLHLIEQILVHTVYKFMVSGYGIC